MNAHSLLHQLLEEYGLCGHNSIDESVAEYVIEAMSEDTLTIEEKGEFVRDIVLELSTLDDVLNAQFLQDLIYASKQLMGVSVESEVEREFPELSRVAPNASRETGVTDSGQCVEKSAGRDNGIDSIVSETNSGKVKQHKGKGRSDHHITNDEGTTTARATTASPNAPTNATTTAAPPRPTVSIPHALQPLQKAISKQFSSPTAAALDADVLTYIYEACTDQLMTLEDKCEVIFACVPVVEDRDLDAKSRDVVARAVVGVALHMRKVQQQTSQNKSRRGEIKTDETFQQSPASSPPLPHDSTLSQPPNPPSADARELHAMLPHLDLVVVQHVLEVKCLHNKQDAALYLLEHAADESGSRQLARDREEHLRKQQALRREQQEQSAAEEKRRKDLIFERYGETEMSPEEYIRAVSRSEHPDVPTGQRSKGGSKDMAFFGAKAKKKKKQGGDDSRVRYRDGVVATYTGEKVIVLKDPKADYDGGSRGTVKTKGKRGPGFVKT